MSRNCPNCGAPIEGVKCPYCGTLLLDFADIEMDKPSYVRIKMYGKVVMLRVVPRTLDVEYNNDDVLFYADNVPMFVCSPPQGEIALRMDIVPDDEGIYKRVKAVSE